MTRRSDPRDSFPPQPGRGPLPDRERICDHPECVGEGLFRAPKAPDNLRSYFWFCLDHVREYNAAWNYCGSMSAEEIDAHLRRDTVWDRPSWPLGAIEAGRRSDKAAFEDPLGVFAAGRNGRRRTSDKADPLAQHYRTMELVPPVSLTVLKARYKELVKRLHPDRNGGDRKSEERLKAINEAYAALKKAAAL